MYIPNDNSQNFSSVDYNQWLKHLETQLTKPIKINKKPQIIKIIKQKTYYKTLGTVQETAQCTLPPSNTSPYILSTI